MQALRRFALEAGRGAAVVLLVVGVAIALDLLGAIDLSRRPLAIAVSGLAAFFVAWDAARRKEERAPDDGAPTP